MSNATGIAVPLSPATAFPEQKGQELRHIGMLDFWRALSILFVLGGHLLPLGPSRWSLNGAVAASGMAMFFTLSGFLITRFLIEDGNLHRFLIRRILRIVPLAWLGMTAALLVAGGTTAQYLGSMSFYGNLPPFFLLPAGGHFWSLCLEVQFYAGVALLVALGGRRALLLLPLFCLAITALRVGNGQYINITTWFRLDEILVGATLALAYEGWLGARARRLLDWRGSFLLLPVLIASAAEWSGPLNYLRPYIAAIMIGASLYHAPSWLRAISRWRATIYIAQVSYALYVVHGVLGETWLGAGDKLVKYAKRPLFFAATFALAHLSTFYYERYWIDLARRLTRRERAGA
ncbi:acyltransferase family protein [Sphingobium sp. CR28]|uniref:acyltransferase family protein n=1 Tax=Sphingobium sp. CR28 TaxID=3400272 RepID=UPI003FF11149